MMKPCCEEREILELQNSIFYYKGTLHFRGNIGIVEMKYCTGCGKELKIQ
jgi:hypothetical protein